MTNITQAAGAYSSALKNAAGAGTDSKSSGDATFGNLVKQGLEDAVKLQYKSEHVSAAALAGKASMTDVLQATTEAQMALNTVLAVRDKVVQAYNSIMSTQM
ncbi:MAG: flagellar hook-basal body complex protein FliE [Alphaproteobacteria bacterium]|nr:flagellar hook-basal body complex protein FliE [Alphaproteobacteria bacterium]MDE2336529.1 flagellar hook-basal body complex protein FliE [Alphaproteobacteria bacterium]